MTAERKGRRSHMTAENCEGMEVKNTIKMTSVLEEDILMLSGFSVII